MSDYARPMPTLGFAPHPRRRTDPQPGQAVGLGRHRAAKRAAAGQGRGYQPEAGPGRGRGAPFPNARKLGPLGQLYRYVLVSSYDEAGLTEVMRHPITRAAR
jgi:hypothetical protein